MCTLTRQSCECNQWRNIKARLREAQAYKILPKLASELSNQLPSCVIHGRSIRLSTLVNISIRLLVEILDGIMRHMLQI